MEDLETIDESGIIISDETQRLCLGNHVKATPLAKANVKDDLNEFRRCGMSLWLNHFVELVSFVH